METTYYAQPYDLDASGFYFRNFEEYHSKLKACRNRFGQVVEEFELQFIDGETLDCALFEALTISQATIGSFITKAHEWSEDDKTKMIIAVGEGGYCFDVETGDPDDIDLDLYPDITMRDLAEQFIDEGLFGEIPQSIAHYIDYDAIARDLAMDYTETTIASDRYVYRLG